MLPEAARTLFSKLQKQFSGAFWSVLETFWSVLERSRRVLERSGRVQARSGAKSRAYTIQFARACRVDRACVGSYSRARRVFDLVCELMAATPKTRFRDPRPPSVCENASAAPCYKNRGGDLETPYRTKQYVRILAQKYKFPEFATRRIETVDRDRCWTF